LTYRGRVACHEGDYQQSIGFLTKSLVMSKDASDKRSIAMGIEGLATVAASQEQLEKALRLFASAKTLRETIGAPLEPIELTEYESILVSVGARVNETTWKRSWAEGCAMTLEQAIAYALETEEPE
jgi:non-specific serine/threonine protein kinase